MMSEYNVATELVSIIPGGQSKYWIKLFQIKKEEEATLTEAEEVIDKIFELEPCVPVTEQQEEVIIEDRSKEEILARAQQLYDLYINEELYDSLCSDSVGRFLAEVKVTRSHQSIDYTTLLQGGDIIETIRGIDNIVKTIKVQKQNSLSGVNLPADQTISASWKGDCFSETGKIDSPEIYISEGVVYWEGMITGVIEVRYNQPFDLLSILTTQEDCSLTALFRLSTDQINVEPPIEDESSETLCDRLSVKITIPPEEGECLIEINNAVLCDCSKQDAGSYVSYRDTSCPEGVGPGNVVGREDTIKYVSCPGEEDEVNDPDYYFENCCEAAPEVLPRCTHRYRVFNGIGLSAEKRETILRTYPGAAITLVGPDDPPCGEVDHEEDVNSKNCCEEVTQLVWDTTNSAETMAPSSFANVFVELDTGTRPISWQVRGAGFYTNAALTQRDVISQDNGIKIYTDADACGTCEIYATDGCSSVSGAIRATVGEWAYRPELDGFAMVGGYGSWGTNSYEIIVTRGRWKTVERVATWCVYSRPSGENCEELGLEECYAKGCDPATTGQTPWQFALLGRPLGLHAGIFRNNDLLVSRYGTLFTCKCYGGRDRQNWEWVCP